MRMFAESLFPPMPALAVLMLSACQSTESAEAPVADGKGIVQAVDDSGASVQWEGGSVAGRGERRQEGFVVSDPGQEGTLRTYGTDGRYQQQGSDGAYFTDGQGGVYERRGGTSGGFRGGSVRE